MGMHLYVNLHTRMRNACAQAYSPMYVHEFPSLFLCMYVTMCAYVVPAHMFMVILIFYVHICMCGLKLCVYRIGLKLCEYRIGLKLCVYRICSVSFWLCQTSYTLHSAVLMCKKYMYSISTHGHGKSSVSDAGEKA
jgi:hypothetical protein